MSKGSCHHCGNYPGSRPILVNEVYELYSCRPCQIVLTEYNIKMLKKTIREISERDCFPRCYAEHLSSVPDNTVYCVNGCQSSFEYALSRLDEAQKYLIKLTPKRGIKNGTA